MSYLSLNQRLISRFQPENEQHRVLYDQFLKTGTWANSPIRFVPEQGYVELPHSINSLLVKYYLGKEFSK